MQKITLAMLLSLVVCDTFAQAHQATQLNCRIEPSMTVEMSSAVEGVISEVLVDKNDKITKGQTLARLDASVEKATADLRQAQAELNSDVEAQQLALQFSKRSLERVKNLYEKKAASSAELDKVTTEYSIAAQQLQQALDRKRQANLEYKRSLADLQRRSLVSPIDGVVIARHKEAGEHIDFDPVLKLAQLNPLKVEVYAPANLYGLIKAGMTAIVTPELGSSKQTYKAEVILVDQVIDGPSNTFGIRLSFPNPDNKLPSGLKCRVNFPSVNIDLVAPRTVTSPKP